MWSVFRQPLNDFGRETFIHMPLSVTQQQLEQTTNITHSFVVFLPPPAKMISRHLIFTLRVAKPSKCGPNHGARFALNSRWVNSSILRIDHGWRSCGFPTLTDRRHGNPEQFPTTSVGAPDVLFSRPLTESHLVRSGPFSFC